jgi:hypothetical protein
MAELADADQEPVMSSTWQSAAPEFADEPRHS